ncbi:hypothetical protein KZZ52_11205 [Dactylosporangium sp. AC04546]|uniref:hypothetical protein n=1 Tax=Dactylosporangium sp. AC04546 TaxID=2862460 RepID=UPI001EDD8560|nr:hypothetical protein [Dactylosporangium sp. AC04546]WVK85915.1 hypothetical protein KZZ52_11205 [Dactylosporangium sp. AC04546]
MTGIRLGVDFGTSNTAAVLRWPDGTTKPLLFDGSELLALRKVGPETAERYRQSVGRLSPHGETALYATIRAAVRQLKDVPPTAGTRTPAPSTGSPARPAVRATTRSTPSTSRTCSTTCFPTSKTG